MKGFFKIKAKDVGSCEYVIKVHGEKIVLKNKSGDTISLTWITHHAAELEFALQEAELSSDGLAVLRHYVYPTMNIDLWDPKSVA